MSTPVGIDLSSPPDGLGVLAFRGIDAAKFLQGQLSANVEQLSIARRFPQADASFDGIICWDLFDYLEKPAVQTLAEQVVRLLRPEGVVLAFFNHSEAVSTASPVYTRHVVVDPRTLEHRTHAASRGKQRPLNNRDIQRLFAPLAITDQFLLKTNVREVIFRKAAESS